MGECRIITIGRQFGSGGHEIGERLAKETGMEFFDEHLVDMAMEYAGVKTEQLRHVDEKKPNTFLYKIVEQPNEKTGYMVPAQDAMFRLQFEVITKLAEEKSCIIVGRCADFVLRGRTDVLSAFVFADMDNRIKRIMERKKLEKKEAVSLIKKTDKQRKSYYNYYTDQKWGSREFYTMTLDSSVLGVEGCIKVLKAAAEAGCIR